MSAASYGERRTECPESRNYFVGSTLASDLTLEAWIAMVNGLQASQALELACQKYGLPYPETKPLQPFLQGLPREDQRRMLRLLTQKPGLWCAPLLTGDCEGEP